MSAAYWRRAMNTRAGAATAGAWTGGGALYPEAARERAKGGQGWASARAVGPRHVIVLAALLIYPWMASPFFTYQIGGQALVLGLIALSLTFLAGYGGMVSLSQMTVAGIASYCFAIFATAPPRRSARAGLGGWRYSSRCSSRPLPAR